MFAARNSARAKEVIKTKDAIEFARKLYLDGIRLVKQGQAYTRSSYADSGNIEKDLNSVDEFDAKNGRTTAKSPMRAVFVIKIALDHMEVEDIVRSYETFKKEYANKTMDAGLIEFSESTQLFGHNAVIQLLRCYIENQPRFTAEQRANARNEPNPFYNSYFHIVGNDGNDKVKNVREILAKDMFVSRLVFNH